MKREKMEYKKPEVVLLHQTPLAIAEVASRICYDSFDLSENDEMLEFRNNPKDFANALLNEGLDVDSSKVVDTIVNVHFHESVVEHLNFSFYVKNVSRENIIEMNRHRLGIATSQKSSRYTIEPLINAWIEHNNTLDTDNYTKFVDVVRKNIIHEDDGLVLTTAEYISGMLHIYNTEEVLQSDLKGKAKKKQNDRVKRALPESWMLEGIWTFNLRALKHFLKLRDSGSAYYGIREVAVALKEALPPKYRTIIDKKFKESLDD